MSLIIFNEETEIAITFEEIKRAQQFAEAVISTVNYSDSNQRNKAKIQEDAYFEQYFRMFDALVSEWIVTLMWHLNQPRSPSFYGKI